MSLVYLSEYVQVQVRNMEMGQYPRRTVAATVHEFIGVWYAVVSGE